MASFSQLRLQQITGSFGTTSALQINDGLAAATTSSLALTDLNGILGNLASAVKRVHGAPSSTEATAGRFYQDLMVGFGGVEKVQFRDSAIFLNSSVDGQLDIDADGEVEISTAKFDVDASSDFDIQGGAASKVSTTAGNLSVDAAAANLILDGHTGVDIDASNSGKVSIDGAGGIDIGVAADVAIDIDADTLDIDASGAVTLDGAGVAIAGGANASSFNVNDGGADAKDLTVSVTGGGDSSLFLTSAGTGTDAIDIDATAGDMLVGKSLADGKTLKIGKNGAVEMTLAPHGTPANEKFSVVNTAGTDNGAVFLHAVAGGLVLSGANGKKVLSKAGAIELSSTGNNASAIKLHTNTGTSETIFIHNQLGDDSKAVEILAEAGGIDMFTQAAGKSVLVRSEQGGVQLSGSLGIGLSGSVAFSADDNMRANAGLQTGTMAFANNPGEFATFRAKDLFTRETSVIGALNALAASTEGGGAVGRKVVTASIAANSDLTLNNATLDDAGGFADSINTSNVLPVNTDVFVNGQLLLSGTSAPGASVTGGDYTLGSPAATGTIRFAFTLEQDDVVIVKTSAAQ